MQEKVDACLRDNLDTPGAIFQLEALIRAANLYRTARDSGLRTGGGILLASQSPKLALFRV